MLSRVTTTMRAASAAANLTATSVKLAAITDESTSGKKLTRFSDDPAAAAKALSVRTQAAQVTQYQRNASDAASWLSTGDTALQNANDTLTKVRTLVVEANNGSLSSSALAGIATEISSLKTQLLGTANTQYLGRSVFAGTSDASAAFSSSDYSYSGTASASVTRRIGDGQTVRVDQDGTAVFGSGSNSVFALLDSISSSIASGTVPSTALTGIDGYLTNIKTAEGSTGAAENAVSSAQNSLTTLATTLESQRSSLEDADTATVAVELSTQQVNYQAALLATAKLTQHSLMDYLS